MWQPVFNKTREVVWVALLVGGLSAVSVGIAVAVVATTGFWRRYSANRSEERRIAPRLSDGDVGHE
jgi:hypothetical protein